MDKIIYLDNAATTKCDEEKLALATKYYNDYYFNPSSLYSGGRKVSGDINSFKNALLGKNRFRKVILTSCGTESDNTAIFGFSKRGNIVTSLGEHSAVYNPFMKMKEKGIEVRFAKLTEGGFVDIDDLLSKIDNNTCFVSIVHVNNETGAINPINQIADRVKQINKNIIFHSDGVQAFGKIDYLLGDNVDLYSVSAHKIGGLKGTGALICKQNLNIPAFILGGGQESGVRSGTENVLGLKLFADVYTERLENMQKNLEHVQSLKQIVIDNIDKTLFKVLSPIENASPYIVSVSALGLRGAVLQNMLDDEGIVVGTGSACSSKKPYSRIISSFTNDPKILNGVVRLSFAPYTTYEEVKFAVDRLNFNASKLSEKIN